MSQERFRWSLWPISVGWLIAAWVAWGGAADLSRLLEGAHVFRGFPLRFVEDWPRGGQIALACGQIGLLAPALPSIAGYLGRRTLLTIGDRGLTLDRWIGWTRVDWADVEKLEFRFGDAIFHVREAGSIRKLHFRPWTIGLDSEGFRDLVERHRPQLTPDEDEGQPWARSSSFNP
jgi:hypothetical protein